MSYKIHLLDALGPVEWSQATWRLEGAHVPVDDCTEELIHPLLLASLPRDGLCVDAGCGSAKWPIHLRRLGYRVVGIDVSREACALAHTTDPGLGVTVGDVRRLPLRSGSVDALLSFGVVEHDERGPDVALAEARRVLRDGGLLVLSVPFDNPLRRLVINHVQSWVTRRRRRAGMPLGFVEYRFTAREVRRFVTRAGFHVASVHPNEYRPPRTVGLWVDWQNLTFDPFATIGPEELFRLPGRWGRIAAALVRHAPWLACGEVVVLAHAR
ncbi:MAG: methyltransferase domain-containing protein [Actinobacteria bacterium]|nr:methyltransferase domain-containing protein [Actinomycetota bacterium]